MTPVVIVPLSTTITSLHAHSQVGCLFARLPCGGEGGGESFKHSESDFEEEEERHLIIPGMPLVRDLPGSDVFAASVSMCLRL